MYLKIDSPKVPSFLQEAKQRPDFNTYRTEFYIVKSYYDFHILGDSELFLEDCAELEEIVPLNMDTCLARFLVLMEKEDTTVQELEKYLPTCKPRNEREE